MFVRTILVTSVLLLFGHTNGGLGQAVVTRSKETFASELRPIIKNNKTTDEAIRGVWRARGYSYLLEVTENGVQAFNETKSVLWPMEDLDASELLFSLSQQGNQAQVTPDRGVPPFVVDRIDAMPVGKSVPSQWTPTKLYTAFAETMAERYVFFDERSFDWNARVEEFRPQVKDSTSESELFALMLQTLEGLEDAHVQLGATIDGAPQRANLGMGKTFEKGIELFAKQTEFTELEDYLQNRSQALEIGIGEKILDGNVNQSCNQLIWGTTKNNVGYLYIAGMSDFSEAETLQEQIAELHAGMETILSELDDTRALIVDVSTNGGGSDIFSRTIASHFADKRRLAFTKGPGDAPDIQHSVYIEPYKKDGADATYTKPVYLVVSDITVSAAEIFTLCMKDFPHVTTVGTNTRGALSDVLSKTLPNGWAFGLSNEIYRDSAGVCHEVVGIPTDVVRTVIEPDKPDLGHADAILQIALEAK